MKSTQRKWLWFLIAVSSYLSACSDNMITKQLPTGTGGSTDSSSTSGSTSSSSRLPTPTTIAQTPTDVAICNGKEMKYLKSQIMVYYDSTGTPRNESLRLWIPRIATDFDTSNYQIRFYKWKADTQGEVYMDSKSLPVRIETKVGFNQVTGYIDSINWGLMKKAFSDNYKTITNLQDTFTNNSFVINLNDATGDYDVLKIAIYDGNNNKIEESDLLIPAFYAHPLTYAQTKPRILAQLHPLLDLQTTSWPGSHFAEILNQNCFY